MPPKKTVGSQNGSQVTAPGEIGNFENDFGRLGSIVDRLESGNLPLEEMLKLYEEGMQLSQTLNRTLTDAELQVKKLAMMHEEMSTAAIEEVHEEVREDLDDEDPF